MKSQYSMNERLDLGPGMEKLDKSSITMVLMIGAGWNIEVVDTTIVEGVKSCLLK